MRGGEGGCDVPLGRSDVESTNKRGAFCGCLVNVESMMMMDVCVRPETDRVESMRCGTMRA